MFEIQNHRLIAIKLIRAKINYITFLREQLQKSISRIKKRYILIFLNIKINK